MRTPGRCLNFETCWLANGRRDIRVVVGDPFVCPACGEPLHAPSIESISSNSILGAVAVSLALVATAGGAGFGMMRLAQTTSITQVASLLHPAKPASAKKTMLAMAPKSRAAAPKPAVAPPAASQLAQAAPAVARPAQTQVAQAAPATPAVPPPVVAAVAAPETVQLASIALKAPAPVLRAASIMPLAPLMVAADDTPHPQAPQAASVAGLKDGPSEPMALPSRLSWPDDRPLQIAKAAPAHPLVLPISFGRPHAPEDDAPARSSRWRHHGMGGGRHSFFMAPAGWSHDDDDVVEHAQEVAPIEQGDADTDTAMAAPSAPDSGQDAPVSYIMPAADNDTAAPQEAAPDDGVAVSRAVLPLQQSDIAAPAASAAQGVRMDTMQTPVTLAPLVVPAVLGGSSQPAYVPAARVDPGLAAQVDRVPDAPARLASLPAAKPDKLVVPSYPLAQEEADQPGRVDVGCVITPHGLPSDCQVQLQVGGTSFAHSVLAWLKQRRGALPAGPGFRPPDRRAAGLPGAVRTVRPRRPGDTMCDARPGGAGLTALV